MFIEKHLLKELRKCDSFETCLITILKLQIPRQYLQITLEVKSTLGSTKIFGLVLGGSQLIQKRKTDFGNFGLSFVWVESFIGERPNGQN